MSNSSSHQAVAIRRNQVDKLLEEIGFIQGHPEVFEIAGIKHTKISTNNKGEVTVALTFFNAALEKTLKEMPFNAGEDNKI